MLLALRSVVKQYLNCSLAKLVYGTTLRLPGEYFHTAQFESGLPDLITVLKGSIRQLRPTLDIDHS